MTQTELLTPKNSGGVGDTDVAESLIRIRGVTKEYVRGSEVVKVLRGIDLDIPRGAFEALMGPSGSGKSTLLNLISGLDRPTQGSVEVAGTALERLGDAALAAWRSRELGIVFQTYNLLPVLNAVENVELPLLLTPVPRKDRRGRAELALEIVGLSDRARHLPSELSGGQQQRVAIARAIVHDPVLLVADEPTGDLDRKSADEILALFQALNEELGKTIVMVTHDPAAAECARAVRRLDKGVLT
ncbi:MAG: ABC transporter ATP-binding protein [Polyangiaceae bacterium]|nr:ABC transporter ATP-binding protein [Myxococcales bacterium]MCB9589747.1 ABC transporter ATP-binding protein [Polyangiaceae bacterium]